MERLDRDLNIYSPHRGSYIQRPDHVASKAQVLKYKL
jgi:hypothetical protein